MKMKRILAYLAAVLAGTLLMHSCYKADPVPQKPYSAENELTAADHPRVIMNENDKDSILVAVNKDARIAKLHDWFISRADYSLGLNDLARVLEGKRLLAVSRDAANRIISCAYAWRMTGNDKYLERAERDVLTVCAFSDWNGSNHFLDVAEMCYAVGIAYDWMYDGLSQKCKTAIVNAVRHFAFELVFRKKYSQNFYENSNNWNQVCIGGLMVAALAIYEECPEDADRIITMGIDGNRSAMESIYSPDGNYPEGYGYWDYGTSYEAVLMMSLESCLGSDKGLGNAPGFDKTGRWMVNMEAPLRLNFNYSDNPSPSTFQSTLWYLAWKFNDPSLLYFELQKVEWGMYNVAAVRDFPTMMVAASRMDLRSVHAPAETFWTGGGKNPLVLVHEDWSLSTSDKFLGIKAGAGNRSHAHLDVGSFVYDAYGTRWSADLGSEGYYGAETYFASQGSIWSMEQNSVRWQIFRYNNFNHSTLTVNDMLHNPGVKVDFAEVIDEPGRKGASMELSPILRGSVQKAFRTITLEGEVLVVKDEISTFGNLDAKVRWTMVTMGEPEIKDGYVLLKGASKNMKLSVGGNITPVTYKIWSTRGAEYDSPNNGYYETGYEVDIPAGRKDSFEVRLEPIS